MPASHQAMLHSRDNRSQNRALDRSGTAEEGKGSLDNSSSASDGSSSSSSSDDDDDDDAHEKADRLVVLSWTKTDVVEEEAIDARARRRSMDASMDMAQSRRTFGTGSVGSALPSPRDDDVGGSGDDNVASVGFAIPANPSYVESKDKARPMPQVHVSLCEDGEDGNAHTAEQAISTMTEAGSSAVVAADDAEDEFQMSTAIAVSKRIPGTDMPANAGSRRVLQSTNSQHKSIAAATARVRAVRCPRSCVSEGLCVPTVCLCGHRWLRRGHIKMRVC